MSAANIRTACYQELARGSRSFRLASTLLARDCRDDVATLYAWCRQCDDAIDGVPQAQQLCALRSLQDDLHGVYLGHTPDTMLLAALQGIVRDRRIPQHYPRELLNGFAMDVKGVRYNTLEELLLYCFRVAGTVGLMMCHVFGVSQYEVLRRAAHMGMAMQLTNICRDVFEDWELGRLYIPEQLLGPACVGALAEHVGSPLPRVAKVPLAAAVHTLLAVAERLYRSGDAGVSLLPLRCALATRAARLIYSSIGQRLDRSGCDVFNGRTIVPKPIQIGLCVRAVADCLRRAPAGSMRQQELTRDDRIICFPADVLPLESIVPAAGRAHALSGGV